MTWPTVPGLQGGRSGRRTEARSAVIYGGRRGGRSDQGRVVGVEDRIEQAGEAAVDVLLAQLRVAPGALDALGDQAGLAHDTQVVGEGRLAQLEPGLLPDLGAPRLAVAGEEADGRQPVRVGQRGQHL